MLFVSLRGFLDYAGSTSHPKDGVVDEKRDYHRKHRSWIFGELASPRPARIGPDKRPSRRRPGTVSQRPSGSGRRPPFPLQVNPGITKNSELYLPPPQQLPSSSRLFPPRPPATLWPWQPPRRSTPIASTRSAPPARARTRARPPLASMP